MGLTSVAPQARGTGVGTSLVDAALAWFADRGLDDVLLHFVDDNVLSCPFWSRRGFTPLVVTLAGDVLSRPSPCRRRSRAVMTVRWGNSMSMPRMIAACTTGRSGSATVVTASISGAFRAEVVIVSSACSGWRSRNSRATPSPSA
ncbi:GNAT family N-acetyltransferase [Microbacterium marinilacus]|uniref:GNAT family N-acetyltransferase n=1 Tax=Microbacterium marinilacus TaxID=415209 RepID=UPI001C8DF84E|nr:GNAT family N-acetyltransferase [Microbacterium marinilacus]MBY0687604.1 GNAT family N-acetyltransferase [Microbacterium marinilacus]